MNRKIKKIETKDFTLVCLFDTNETVFFDMTDIIKQSGPMIEPLRDHTFFRKVFLESGAPTWPNGFDLCPDVIYHQGGKMTAA